MFENKLKRLLKSGGTAVGTMVCDARSPQVAQALAAAGFDYFILDTEHGSYSLQTVNDLMTLARLAGITPIVRVPDDGYPFIARTLDAGALGLMTPRVKSRAQVERIVRCMKYPPWGERGMSSGRTNTDYQGAKLGAYRDHANAETMLIVQIETREAIEDIAGIVAVPGVDAVLMGTNDLTLALGLDETNHPKVDEAIHKVIAAAKKQGLPSGTHIADLARLKGWRDAGMRLLMYSYDFGLMMSAGQAALKELRGE